MLENNVVCLLLDGKLKTASRWQKFVIESLSRSNDSFKTAESFRSESNDRFYEWLSESVIRPRQRGFGFEHRNETKTALLLVSYIAELSGAFFARISWNFQVSSMYIKT